MLLVYLIVDLLAAVFTARMVQRKPCMQLHPEALLQVHGLWVHIHI